MAEGVTSQPLPSAPEDAAAARAAEQARLRKERREAKIKAGGSARLNRITRLAGGLPRDPLPQAANTSDPPLTSSESKLADTPGLQAPAPSSVAGKPKDADPDEVDISQHYYAPRPNARQGRGAPTAAHESSSVSDAHLRQLMLGLVSPGPGATSPSPGANPSDNLFPGGPGGDDPMLRLLTQMMGGGQGAAAGPDGGGNPFAGFSGMMGQQQQQQQQQQATAQTDTYAVVWRLLHLIVALGLGFYIALLGNFTGTKEARDRASLASSGGAALGESGAGYMDLDDAGAERRHLFFWSFATAEAILLTSRFFLDRARAPPPGIMWTVISFMPPSIKSYLETLLRYVQIFTTVRSDLLVCVFILGVCSWLRSA